MLPTKRLILIVVLGSLLIALISKDTLSLIVSGSYNFIIILGIIADLALTPRKGVFSVSREYDYKMSLGASNPVKITLVNLSKRYCTLLIKDEPPLLHFASSGNRQKLELSARQKAEMIYHVVPAKRGDYSFGVINIRFRSRLGLFTYQIKIDDTENKSLKVYPNIQDIRHQSLNAHKGYILESGIKPSGHKGLGTDFEGLRDFVPDDEYRRVNWTASARRGKLVTNEYRDEKSQNILLVLDSGRMMTADIQSLSKFDLAVNAGLMLGYVGVSKDDKVGLMVFDNQVRLFLPPKKGKGQLQRILSSLYNIQANVVEADYRAACHYIMEQNKKRSLVCIFTDLIDHEASTRLISYVSLLTKRHLVVCITLIDSEVIRTANLIPANSQELFEKSVAEGVLRDRERAIALLQNVGVNVINVPAENLSAATVNKYLELKGRGSV